jgi:hypothetical protein
MVARVTFEARPGWTAFEKTDGAVWRYRNRGASGVVAILREPDGTRLYEATHNDPRGTGTSLATGSRRRAAWFAMKDTLEGVSKAVKYPRAPVPRS